MLLRLRAHVNTRREAVMSEQESDNKRKQNDEDREKKAPPEKPPRTKPAPGGIEAYRSEVPRRDPWEP